MIKISPSVLACDFSRLGEEISAMQKAGADMIHLDVMDGHFVPNISFGAPVIKMARGVCDILFDVHLMITEPLRYIGDFADAGAGIITFHIESAGNTEETIRRIRSHGISPGLSLKPKTPVESLLPYLHLLDMILVMTVEPGFGGQDFMPDMLPKLDWLQARREDLGLAFDIQVDGGIDNSTAPLVCARGADNLVAGSSLFGSRDYSSAITGLRAAAGSFR
ncbi:MAG: ribulose-phosphate 3-epimerase [Oscillospiraceae bacterium]|nr:ribulose-phosphate 3-epimerase [Oscillospiraceae bacterium]